MGSGMGVPTGESQIGDVKSVTRVSQFGDSHNQSTNDIIRPYISCMPTPRKIYCREYENSDKSSAVHLTRTRCSSKSRWRPPCRSGAANLVGDTIRRGAAKTSQSGRQSLLLRSGEEQRLWLAVTIPQRRGKGRLLAVPTTPLTKEERARQGTNASAYQHLETIIVLMRSADYRCSDCSTREVF